MFGHQSHQDEDNDMSADKHTVDESVGASMPWQHPGTPLEDEHHDQPATLADNTIADDDSVSSSDTAAVDEQPTEKHDEPKTHVYAPDNSDSDDNHGDSDDEAESDVKSSTSTEPPTNDLIDIKKDALGKLTPLVGHLDQTPDEKFRTTMMMIQASDNQGLVQTAYDAAQQISDEKARAQALLDVINEINYFTQPKDKHD